MRDADSAELERLDRQQADAWGQDGAAFAATFTDDADLVDVMGGHFHGRAAIEETMTQGFATFMAGTRLSEPEKRTVAVRQGGRWLFRTFQNTRIHP